MAKKKLTEVPYKDWPEDLKKAIKNMGQLPSEFLPKGGLLPIVPTHTHKCPHCGHEYK